MLRVTFLLANRPQRCFPGSPFPASSCGTSSRLPKRAPKVGRKNRKRSGNNLLQSTGWLGVLRTSMVGGFKTGDCLKETGVVQANCCTHCEDAGNSRVGPCIVAHLKKEERIGCSAGNGPRAAHAAKKVALPGKPPSAERSNRRRGRVGHPVQSLAS